MLVYIEQARRLIACNVNVGPAIIVEIRRDRAQTVTSARGKNTRLRGDVGERSVSVIVIERVVSGRKAVRAAPDGESLPFTVLGAAGFGYMGQIEIDVVGHEDVQPAIAVIVDESAAGSPARTCHRQPRALGDVFEFAVSEITVEAVVAVIGHEQVGMAVVIDVTGARRLSP